MQEIDRISVSPESATIYEHGWQSWSPTASYRLPTRHDRSRETAG
jgi:hypothetical protein